MNRLSWLVLWFVCLGFSPLVAGEDWPQFRGPARDGVIAGGDLHLDWREEPPKEAWRVPIGEGFAGIVVTDAGLFTMYADETTEYLANFDPATGKERWAKRLGDRFKDQFGDGPRSTPSVDGEIIYALGAMGDLHAFRTADGEPVWHVSLTETFGAKVSTWGYSTAPLIEGDMLVVEAGGGKKKAVAALNKADGSTLWTAGTGVVGYSSPVVAELVGERQFVFLLAESVTVYNLTGISMDGKVLWNQPLPGFHIATPILTSKTDIFVSASNDDGCTMVSVKPSGDGLVVDRAWTNRVMRNTFNSSVYKDGYLYGFNNATLRCVDVKTGDYKWAKRGYGKGSLIAVGDHLIALSDRGKLVSARAFSDKYEEHGKLQALKGKSWTSPSLADGRLYLRNQTEMVCYDLRKN